MRNVHFFIAIQLCVYTLVTCQYVTYDSNFGSGCTGFDSIPNPLPSNVASVGFEALGLSQIGDYICLCPNENSSISQIVFAMSSWALHSDFPSFPECGWPQTITVNVYEANTTGEVPTVSTLLFSSTKLFVIPFRPEANPNCTSNRWMDSNGVCRSGLAFLAIFDLGSNPISLPGQFIYGIQFDTQHHGVNPIGLAGPWNSLNMGVVDMTPYSGYQVIPGSDFINSSSTGSYSDGGAGGLNVFRYDEGLAPYVLTTAFIKSDCGNDKRRSSVSSQNIVVFRE